MHAPRAFTREARRRQNLEEGRALAAEALAQADRVHATFDELLVELERQPIQSVSEEGLDYVAERIARLEIRVEGLKAAIATHAKLLSEGPRIVETLQRAPPTEMQAAWREAQGLFPANAEMAGDRARLSAARL